MTFASDFDRAFCRHLQRRITGHRFWDTSQIVLAEGIVSRLHKCVPVTQHFSSEERRDLISALGRGDLERVNSIMDLVQKDSLQPWCIDSVRDAISTSLVKSPTFLRDETNMFLGGDVKWPDE